MSAREGTTSTRRHLTVSEFLTEFRVARSTWYDWRAKGTAPRCIKLPNGQLRIRRADLERWENSLEKAT
ncbi:helix-turn-helix transcriptional regulator [Amycolatopsis anabasis]|uniref:helix-turn-helix transcriptional regulator n=1 Tax=Amycolatopsis anabasis TaxID=1840409 RepID=UPI00131D9791|nr:helix-turn-helix domain-containing protein [Amycolatopsis anabasis]